MFAGIGSMQALVPPQMMLIEAVGAIAILQLKRSITPWSAASGHGPTGGFFHDGQPVVVR